MTDPRVSDVIADRLGRRAGEPRAAQRRSANGRRKNVLVLMADEQSWDTLGHNGNPLAHTPHLDALTARGASFQHCYTPYPLCCPARASLWTGLMPHNHHVMGNWRHIRPDLADGGLVRPFAAAGYHTLYTGKWHVPGTTPARMGWADSAAIPAVIRGRDRGRYIEPYRAYAEGLGYRLVPNHIENLTEGDLAQLRQPGKAPCGTAEIPLEHFLETWQTTRFLECLDARPADKPFFAVCSYNAPHFPMIVPVPFDRLIDPKDVPLPAGLARSLEQGVTGKPAEVASSHYASHAADLDAHEWRRLIAHYWGLCALIDHQVGRVMDYLRAHQLEDDTIVVFTADHGDMMGAHGLLEKGYPLHYEPALRLPLIIADPDVAGHDAAQAGTGLRPTGLVSLLDVVPTLAALTGVSLPETHEGRSAAAALSDPDAPLRTHTLSETFTFDGSEGGDGEYTSLDAFKAHHGTVNLSLRTPDARYVFRWADTDEYYDLVADPDELENLVAAPACEAAVTDLRATLLRDLAASSPLLAGLVRERLRAKADTPAALLRAAGGEHA